MGMYIRICVCVSLACSLSFSRSVPLSCSFCVVSLSLSLACSFALSLSRSLPCACFTSLCISLSNSHSVTHFPPFSCHPSLSLFSPGVEDDNTQAQHIQELDSTAHGSLHHRNRYLEFSVIYHTSYPIFTHTCIDTNTHTFHTHMHTCIPNPYILAFGLTSRNCSMSKKQQWLQSQFERALSRRSCGRGACCRGRAGEAFC